MNVNRKYIDFSLRKCYNIVKLKKSKTQTQRRKANHKRNTECSQNNVDLQVKKCYNGVKLKCSRRKHGKLDVRTSNKEE